MANPDFPLASWEVPPGSNIPLVAPADVRTKGRRDEQDIEYLIRAVEFENYEYLFYREVESNEIGNWLLTGLNSLSDIAHYAPLTYQFDYVRFAPDDGARVFCLDGTRYGAPFPHTLVVGSKGGTWEARKNRVWFGLPQLEPRFAHLRASQVGRIVRGELESPDSDVRYAFDWLHLDEAEKQVRLIGISHPNLKRLKTLMRSLLRLQEFLPTEFTETACTWQLNFDVEIEPVSYDSQKVMSDGFMMASPDLPSRLTEWGILLAQHFLRGISADVRTRALNLPSAWIEVETAPPTAHEKLEAQLILRQWCEEIGAQREFADLVAAQNA